MATRDVLVKTIKVDNDIWISKFDVLYFLSIHAEELDKIDRKEAAVAMRELRDRIENQIK